MLFAFCLLVFGCFQCCVQCVGYRLIAQRALYGKEYNELLVGDHNNVVCERANRRADCCTESRKFLRRDTRIIKKKLDAL